MLRIFHFVTKGFESDTDAYNVSRIANFLLSANYTTAANIYIMRVIPNPLGHVLKATHDKVKVLESNKGETSPYIVSNQDQVEIDRM